MALKCDFCGKAPHYGNVISHANNKRRRRWNPNLKRMRAVVAGGKKQDRVGAAGTRGGRAKKDALVFHPERSLFAPATGGRPVSRSHGIPGGPVWPSLSR